MEAVAQRQPLAAALEIARRHGLVRDEEIVQAAGAGQADLVGGVEHAGAVAQQRSGVVERDGLQEGLWREPGPALEEMMEVRGRQADMGGDLLDLRLAARGLGHEFDRRAHALVIVGEIDWREGFGVRALQHGLPCAAWPPPLSLPASRERGRAGPVFTAVP